MIVRMMAGREAQLEAASWPWQLPAGCPVEIREGSFSLVEHGRIVREMRAEADAALWGWTPAADAWWREHRPTMGQIIDGLPDWNGEASETPGAAWFRAGVEFARDQARVG